MTPVQTFSGKNVALFGLGGSGLATAKALLAGGADVAAWDDGAAGRDSAAAAGVPLVDLANADWSGFAALILSPGVPLTHPEPHWTVGKAKAAGVAIIGDIELYCRERHARAPDAPFIAITGTNGKSTTTALIAHILRVAGEDVQLGGNIGTPILALEPPAEGRFHVIELSSFQIDLTPDLQPSIGVLLNLTPDHIDRHGTMERYAAIKERLVRGADAAVIGVDDDFTEAIALRHEKTGRPTVRISVARSLASGIHARGREIFAWSGHGRKLADLSGIATLRGDHNAQNAAAAVAVALKLGIAPAIIQQGLSTYPGLPHRLEQVGRVGKVLLINDSKATNADSTEKALTSFPEGIFWIAGGKAKEGGIAALAPHFPRVAKTYLIGEAAGLFAAQLPEGAAKVHSGTLDLAVRQALEDALASNFAEPVILLSPSCASYDQYRNFEMRGAHFREIAASLPGFTSNG